MKELYFLALNFGAPPGKVPKREPMGGVILLSTDIGVNTCYLYPCIGCIVVGDL
jgi:hypothetical protein